jgi:hypothetical protein
MIAHSQGQADIDAFRDKILNLKTWPERLQASLLLVHRHPELANSVGLKPLSNDQFAANTKIYADFTRRKPNTVNFGFRTHGIKGICALPGELRVGLVAPSNWKLRMAPGDLFDAHYRSRLHFSRQRHQPPEAVPLASQEKQLPSANELDEWGELWPDDVDSDQQ